MTSDVQQLFLLGSVREGRDRSPARRPARIARIGTAAALGAVGTTGRDRELHAPDCAQRVVMIDDTIADAVDDLAPLLKPSAHPYHWSPHDLPAVDLEPVGPKTAVGVAGFVLDGYKQPAPGRTVPSPPTNAHSATT